MSKYCIQKTGKFKKMYKNSKMGLREPDKTQQLVSWIWRLSRFEEYNGKTWEISSECIIVSTKWAKIGVSPFSLGC